MVNVAGEPETQRRDSTRWNEQLKECPLDAGMPLPITTRDYAAAASLQAGEIEKAKTPGEPLQPAGRRWNSVSVGRQGVRFNPAPSQKSLKD